MQDGRLDSTTIRMKIHDLKSLSCDRLLSSESGEVRTFLLSGTGGLSLVNEAKRKRKRKKRKRKRKKRRKDWYFGHAFDPSIYYSGDGDGGMIGERSLALTVSQLRNIISEAENPVSGQLTIYHCGWKKTGANFRFDTRLHGTGEGWSNPPLGPGIYFSDDLLTALLYCKYSSKPKLTVATVDMSKLYNIRSGEPHEKHEALLQFGEELRDILGLDSLEEYPPYRYRRVFPNGVAAAALGVLGLEKTIEKLKELGIHGWVTRINPDALEICIFDPDILNVVSESTTDTPPEEDRWGRKYYTPAHFGFDD